MADEVKNLPENKQTGLALLNHSQPKLALPIPTKEDHRVRIFVLETADKKNRPPVLEQLELQLDKFPANTEFNIREAQGGKGFAISVFNQDKNAIYELVIPNQSVDGKNTTLERIRVNYTVGDKIEHTDIHLAKKNSNGNYINANRPLDQIKTEFEKVLNDHGRKVYNDTDKAVITPKDMDERKQRLLEKYYEAHPEARPPAPITASVNPVNLPHAGGSRSSYLA